MFPHGLVKKHETAGITPSFQKNVVNRERTNTDDMVRRLHMKESSHYLQALR